MTQPLDLDQIEARATSEHLTPGPWRLEYEQCDCSDGYCHHGAYVAAVHAPTPTSIAAERLKDSAEEPRDYDCSRTEMGDFSAADWELMAHAREDVPAMAAEIRRLRAELATANARLDATARLAGRQETKLRKLGAPATVDAVAVEAPQCDVEFEGGGRCAKPAGHRPPGSQDPHVPEPATATP